MIGLLTSVYNGYDTLKPLPPQSVEVDAVCVTDDPTLSAEGWRVMVRPFPNLHPNKAAKQAKMMPWRFAEGESSVWIDASFRVLSPTFVEEITTYATPIAQFIHPWRDCVYDEAIESSLIPKYTGEDVLGQAGGYRSEGFPEHWGLWATGVIARQHTPEVQRFGYDWFRETQEKTYQDQLSEPFCLWQHGLRPQNLPGTYFAGPWVSYEGSGRH